MNEIFSRTVLAGWIAAAVIVFAITMYLKGAGDIGSPDSYGTSTYSRSAIGHAGIAELLRRLEIPVVQSRGNPSDRLSAGGFLSGGVLVIAEPRPGPQIEENLRSLLREGTILFVLPKWTGAPDEDKTGWVREVRQQSIGLSEWALRLVVPNGTIVRQAAAPQWTTNIFNIVPNVVAPTQLFRGERVTPLIGNSEGMLLGEISERTRKIWILADPDIIANHGLARPPNAELATAIISRLRGRNGVVVFDETIHGYVAKATNPLALLFQFPFVIATVQAAIAIALLLWATLARFGAPQSAPAALSAGRAGLLQNVAQLIAFTGHHPVIIRRYVQETIRDVARQLHAPATLSGAQLVAWLQRVALARGVRVDCGDLAQRASELAEGQRRDPAGLVRIARDIFQWKREIIDGRPRDSRTD